MTPLDGIFTTVYNSLFLQNGILGAVRHILGTIAPFSYVISFWLFVGIVRSGYFFLKFRNEDLAYYHSLAQDAGGEGAVGIEQKNEKWMRVQNHIESENPNDWRLAILECDVILEEMIDVMGYRGETLGEKMQKVERSDFQTIDAAWEAHKVRNRIAHSGGDYILSEREARRVIALYKQVFEEFHYI